MHGAIRDLGNLPAHKVTAIGLGLAFGMVTEVMRKLLYANGRYRLFTERSKFGFAVGWTMDSILLSSPYALSFGGFVELPVAAWFAIGGILTSIVNTIDATRPRKRDEGVPEDMSTMSLIGGGLVAGESLYALGVGVIGLLALFY